MKNIPIPIGPSLSWIASHKHWWPLLLLAIGTRCAGSLVKREFPANEMLIYLLDVAWVLVLLWPKSSILLAVFYPRENAISKGLYYLPRVLLYSLLLMIFTLFLSIFLVIPGIYFLTMNYWIPYLAIYSPNGPVTGEKSYFTWSKSLVKGRGWEQLMLVFIIEVLFILVPTALKSFMSYSFPLEIFFILMENILFFIGQVVAILYLRTLLINKYSKS